MTGKHNPRASLTRDDGFLRLDKGLIQLGSEFEFVRFLTQSTFAQLLVVTRIPSPASSPLSPGSRSHKRSRGSNQCGSDSEREKKRKKFEEPGRQRERFKGENGKILTKRSRESGGGGKEDSREKAVAGKKGYVLKIFNKQFEHVGIQESTYLRQARLSDSCNVSGIVRWEKAFRIAGHVCIAMELLGPSLSSRITEKGPFSLPEIRSFACDILGSLVFLHETLGLIHADLKPENICTAVNKDISLGTKEKVKLIDFGNGIPHKDTAIYYDNFEVQTFAYRAPEVLFGLEFESSIDLWGLGCTLAELYTGKPLFSADKAHQLLFAMLNILGEFPIQIFEKGKFYGPLQFHLNRLYQHHPQVKKLIPKSKEGRVGKLLRKLQSQRQEGKNSTEIRKTPEKLPKNNPADHEDSGVQEFVRFLLTLLTYNPNDRLSARQALRHPFISRMNQTSEP
ncbi:hypothetical protein AAMO2058_001173600 [Amorphochlora amoebiformis]